VLSALRDHADYISLHTYIGNQQNDLEHFLGQSQLNLERYIDTTAALIREVQGGRPGARPIYIAYDEWNVWYRVHNEGKLEEVYNFEDALAMGMFFNVFFRHADTVKMANLAQMVNVIAPIMTNKQGMFLQPIYFPIAEYGKQRGNVSLTPWVSSPTYTLGGGRGTAQSIPYLDVSATYDGRGHAVFVNVLNRSKGRALATRIECQEGTLGKEAATWQMNHDDFKATHAFGNDKKIVPVSKTTTLAMERNGFTYTFPAHSLTILKLKVD
jgi:alpha-N-arabinofuranosidase